MRFRHVVAIVVIGVAASLTGQEEPLPVVTPLAGVQIAFSKEPILDPPKPTLAGAAHANDFATFDALYRDAQRRGENVAAYATLHDLWTYSVTDPIGAFYGTAMHDRLARTYPGFATFIEDQRIVDDHGNVFYPTSETRAFLLARAEAGVVAPSPVRVAEHRAVVEHRAIVTPTPAPAPRVRHHKASAPKAAPKAAPKPAPKLAPKPAPKPAPAIAKVVPPVVISPAPVEKPIAPPIVISPAPVEKSIAPPVAVVKPAPEAAQVPAKTQKSGADRGLLLVIVGLIGIGLLALILRAPREEVPSVIGPPPPPGSDHR